MEKFKAAVLTKQHEPLEFFELEHLSPTIGQVKIKMISSGLCGAQWNEINAIKGVDNYLPHMMGHEGYGQVVEVGDGVKNVNNGDFVILHWRKGAGIECFGPKYNSEIGPIGSGSVTTFSQYTIVSENRVSKVQKNDELKFIYPLLGCALSTTWGVFNKEISVKKESKIFIIGAGGLGLSFLFWAKIYNYQKIVILDKFKSKEKFVKPFDVEFNSIEHGFNFELYNNHFDLIIDTTGDINIISNAFNLLNKNAQFVLIGQPKKGESLILQNALKLFDGIKMFASDGGGFDPANDFEKLVNEVCINSQLAKHLVSDIIKLDEVNNGFETMKSGNTARIIIDFDKK